MYAKANGAPPDGLPFALVERGPHGVALTTLNNAARRTGLRTGQRHSDACAMVPGLATAPADPASDRTSLDRLARWCWRWTPSVAVDWRRDGMAGLFLDVTGAAHLCGGEAGLLADIGSRLHAAGVKVRGALADTAGAAWGLARFGGAAAVISTTGSANADCAGLPLAALRLDDTMLAGAAALGLRRVGDLLTMPRAGLARRFQKDGLELVERLDQMLGLAPEALALLKPPPRYTARRAFAEPVTDTAALATALPDLCTSLAEQLAVNGQGALALNLTGFRSDGELTGIGIRLSLPSRQVPLWLRLFAERGLDHLDLGFGVDAVLLTAAEAADLCEDQGELHTGADNRRPLLELCDRIEARLGSRVLAGRTRASWLPERTEQWQPVEAVPQAVVQLDRARPLLLLDPPEPIEPGLFEIPEGAPVMFRWRRVERRVRLAEGPERLSPEWWRGLARRPLRTRDYYRVEDEQGCRYWLFREGLYGWEDGDRAPTWWMHGLFS